MNALQILTEKRLPPGSSLEIQANHITMCYEDEGEGALPVIFIHGFPFDKSSWRPQLDFLGKTGRVIAYDIRGFGRSGTDESEVSIDLLADDLIRFMDALHISKAVVCGLSMGGYILLNAVNHFPGRFQALVLCDTQCIADSPEAKEKRLKTIHQIAEGRMHSFARNSVSAAFCRETLLEKQPLVEGIKKVILSTSPQTITDTLKALADRRETASFLKDIHVPTLIICGTEDTLTPMAQSEYMLGNIPHSSLHRIGHAGHLSNLEQPDEFNRVLASFLARIDKGWNVAIK